jgi:hypothetical protein
MVTCQQIIKFELRLSDLHMTTSKWVAAVNKSSDHKIKTRGPDSQSTLAGSVYT